MKFGISPSPTYFPPPPPPALPHGGGEEVGYVGEYSAAVVGLNLRHLTATFTAPRGPPQLPLVSRVECGLSGLL